MAPPRTRRSGLRHRLSEWLRRPGPHDVDPDTPVELAVLALAEGPMLVAALEREGIRALGYEAENIRTGAMSWMRVLVRHADLPAAHEVLDRVRSDRP